MMRFDLSSYKIFLISNSILAFAIGIFTPFWFIFVNDFGGGIEQFGFAIGIMVLAQSVTSYFSGKISDKIGRKLPLLIAVFSLSATVFGYTIISSVTELYILQVLNGVAGAILLTMESTFLGDLTRKSSRGSNIGKYHFAVGVTSSVAMMGSGFLINEMGFKFAFYMVSLIILMSGILLLRIRD